MGFHCSAIDYLDAALGFHNANSPWPANTTNPDYIVEISAQGSVNATGGLGEAHVVVTDITTNQQLLFLVAGSAAQSSFLLVSGSASAPTSYNEPEFVFSNADYLLKGAGTHTAGELTATVPACKLSDGSADASSLLDLRLGKATDPKFADAMGLLPIQVPGEPWGSGSCTGIADAVFAHLHTSSSLSLAYPLAMQDRTPIHYEETNCRVGYVGEPLWPTISANELLDYFTPFCEALTLVHEVEAMVPTEITLPDHFQAYGDISAGLPPASWDCGNPDRLDNQACTVLMTHGLVLTGSCYVCPGSPSNPSMTTWNDLRNLYSSTYSNVVRVGQYGGDCGVEESAMWYGGHDKYWPNNHHDDASCTGEEPAVHANSVSWRHMAYHFAWFIYEKYSQDGTLVDVVAHSAGGLVIRYALWRVHEEDPLFPPNLLIEDVVTLATPHNGGTNACYLPWNYPYAGYRQMRELCINDQFMWRIKEGNVQSVGTQDWTLLSSSEDDWVTAYSGIDMTANHQFSWVFECAAYEHDDFYKEVDSTTTQCHYHAQGAPQGAAKTMSKHNGGYEPGYLSLFAALFGSA